MKYEVGDIVRFQGFDGQSGEYRISHIQSPDGFYFIANSDGYCYSGVRPEQLSLVRAKVRFRSLDEAWVEL